MLSSELAGTPSRVGIMFALALFFGVAFLTLIGAPSSRASRSVPATRAGIDHKHRVPEFVPGELLVRYKSEETAKRQQSITVELSNGGRAIPMKVERFEGSDLVAGLRFAHVAAEDTLRAIQALRAKPEVLYAEPNYIMHPDNTPNDPQFGSLYGMTKIGTPTAWDTTTGSSTVVVGIVDEGIDIAHPDLQANIWTNPAPGSIPGISGDLHGYDFINNSGTIPAEFHGTHVSGTVGAVGNNNVGVVGVNWQVRLMSLRFLGPGGGTNSNAIRAYVYAKQMRDLWESSGGVQGANIRVLNNSYGGDGYSQASLDAINALNQSGIVFVVSEGNEAVDTDANPHYPSGYVAPNVISLAATDSADALASFSNFGSQTATLGAPGVGVLSTTPGNSYQSVSGTSMASPHAAGAAALLLAANPNLNIQQLTSLLSFNGDLVPSLNGKTLTGRRLNIANSLAALAENDTTPPGTVTNFHVNSQNGRSLNLGWTTSGDDGALGQASLYQLTFTDAITSAVLPLKSLAPAASSSAQTLDVRVPYRHTNGTLTLREFDNAGNQGTPATISVTISTADGDPYSTALGSPDSLSTGGTQLGLTFDDRYRENYPLPFAFPFFGQTYSTVAISSNGNLFFQPPPKRPNGDANDVPSSAVGLSSFKMISGLWDDLYLGTDQRADADVYVVQPNANTIVFRWQGVPCNFNGSTCTFGAPVNFEVELRNNGTIKSRYGSGNTGLFPVVGISGGEPDAYVISTHTSESTPIDLTNAQTVTNTLAAPTAAPIRLSGQIVTSDATPIAGATLTVLGGSGTIRVITNRDGFYTAENLQAGGFYVVTPTRTNYLFTPANRSFSLVADKADAVFTGTAVGPDANPLESPEFFVRQQYVDFLDREPEQGGLDYWSAQLRACNGDERCLNASRIAVSAAFFIEQEFQNTGSFIYRLYKSSLGRQPNLVEFTLDRKKVTAGGTLEERRAAFADEWVQRSAFKHLYPDSMTTADFVNRLFDTALLQPYADERRQQIEAMRGGNTRAQVLRDVIETAELRTREYNPSFVLMEYFGYLRRDPDPEGYDFWLDALNNRERDNYRAMVCAFITSKEYQQRFSSVATRANDDCGR